MTLAEVRWDGPALRTARDEGEWVVESLARPGGAVQVRRVGTRLHLRVADRADLAPGVARIDRGRTGSTDAWLHSDGGVSVRCVAAPPALHVSEGASRLLPALPGDHDTRVLEDGDLLVMCSAGALDHMPAGIGAVLAWSPLSLGASEPATLLDRLMADSDEGAALLARYRRPTDRPTRPHRTEEDR